MDQYVGPYLVWGTIAPCVDSLLCYGSSDGLNLSLKIVSKSKVCICISHIYILIVLLLLRLGESLAYPLEFWFLHMCVSIIFPIDSIPSNNLGWMLQLKFVCLQIIQCLKNAYNDLGQVASRWNTGTKSKQVISLSNLQNPKYEI
jgi:hypothetical protein